MSSAMLNCVYGIEMLNDKYNPFDLKLTDWSQQMNRDISSYYDIFGELYEKYGSRGSTAPEIKLIFMITASAIKFHMFNSFIGSRPSINSTLKSDPKLTEDLRRNAQADKYKQMNENERESMQQYFNKENEKALKQAKDIKMLNRQKQEYMLSQDMLKKQQELNELQKKLDTIPETYSDQPLIKPVKMPNIMLNNTLSNNQVYQQPQQTQLPQHTQLPQQYNNSQIHHFDKTDDHSNADTKYSINPELRDLISQSQKKSELNSISNDDTYSNYSISVPPSSNSKTKIKRVIRKKKIPKVDTI